MHIAPNLFFSWWVSLWDSPKRKDTLEPLLDSDNDDDGGGGGDNYSDSSVDSVTRGMRGQPAKRNSTFYSKMLKLIHRFIKWVALACGDDWTLLLALGILTALIGYTMDWCIMKIQRLRMIAVDSVEG